MILRPPRSTLTDTLFPYTTLFRSLRCHRLAGYAPGDCTGPSALQGPTDRRGKPIDRHVGDTRRWYSTSPASHRARRPNPRSQDHTSELQTLMRTSYAVYSLKNNQTSTRLHSSTYCESIMPTS